MTMINCRECQNAVSNKATKCPQCGIKVPCARAHTRWVVTQVFIGIPMALFIALGMTSCTLAVLGPILGVQ